MVEAAGDQSVRFQGFQPLREQIGGDSLQSLLNLFVGVMPQFKLAEYEKSPFVTDEIQGLCNTAWKMIGILHRLAPLLFCGINGLLDGAVDHIPRHHGRGIAEDIAVRVNEEGGGKG